MSKKLILSGEERDYEIEVEALTWRRTVIVAAAYGWRPGGPQHPSLNHYAETSTVCEEDAHGLAVALEKALSDIPNQRREDINEEDLPPLEYFGGWMRDVLDEIIELCRRGEFLVERR